MLIKDFTYPKQAVDAPGKKCVLTQNNKETFYE